MRLRFVAFSVNPHNVRVGPLPWLRWFPDHLGRGPHGRRHDRKMAAFMLGFRRGQKEADGWDDGDECPWSKRTYQRAYERGMSAFRQAQEATRSIFNMMRHDKEGSAQ